MSRSLLPFAMALLLGPTAAFAAEDAAPADTTPLGADPTVVAARGSDDKDSKAGKGKASRKSSGKAPAKRGGGAPSGERRDNDGGEKKEGDRPADRDDGPANRETRDGAGHAPDPYRAQPNRGQAARPREQANRTEPQTRHLATGASAPGRNASEARRAPAQAPANFRAGSAAPSSHARAQAAARGGQEATSRHASAERTQHARATASRHHQAAASRRHHATAAARHHAYAARHYRPARWYAPRTWFSPWHATGPHHWYHGVFVYGPAPWYHHPHHAVVVVDGDGGGGRGDGGGDAERAPERQVERAGTFALGVRGGSYMGSYDSGAVFGDAGLGLAARYRPVEAVGLELSWQHHDQTWDSGSERVYEPVQASVQAFAFSWSKFNPYALAGVTYTSRNVNDDVGGRTVESDGALWGPHAGVGLELGVGKQASLNFDVRWVGYLNKPEADPTTPGAATANMGLNFYF